MFKSLRTQVFQADIEKPYQVLPLDIFDHSYSCGDTYIIRGSELRHADKGEGLPLLGVELQIPGRDEFLTFRIISEVLLIYTYIITIQ